ncbi:MAG: GNAT family N-acetyltransferase [Enterobacteriaceae bacterium]|jgi:ribosomal protein S18 acetylase RimI-like enzyme|nr:GNAT family N-acetyltransferase [Enterobacteriaceae bacterium]
MIIRTAVLQDLDAISALCNLLFTEMAALQPDRFKDVEQDRNFIISAINDDKFHSLVAEDNNGDIKGFCIAQKQTTPPYNAVIPRNYGYVIDLAVSRDVRSQGIGQQLLAEMKKWAQENHLTHLELTVLANNTAAIKFYEREGYQEISKLMAIKL